jgi:hypothetical protein
MVILQQTKSSTCSLLVGNIVQRLPLQCIFKKTIYCYNAMFTLTNECVHFD